MSYLATVTGTYKTKVYINLIFFKIVRGWRTDHFEFSQRVDVPDFHRAWPVKNLPLTISLDVTPQSVDFGIQVLSQNFPIQHIALGSNASDTLHWEPIKGVLIDAIASFKPAP